MNIKVTAFTVSKKFYYILECEQKKLCVRWSFGLLNAANGILPQNALRRDCNGKCIESIVGHN